jgi:hypothetical protein
LTEYSLKRSPSRYPPSLIRTTILLFLILFLLSLKFGAEPYRYDELWLVGAAPSSVATPLLSRVWIEVVGTEPVVTRWLAFLVTLMGIASAGRLGASLYGREMLFWVPALTGSIAIVMDFGGRAAVYAMPFFLSSLLCWMVWRWLKSGSRLDAGIYVAGAVLMGAHYPAGLWLVGLHMIIAGMMLRWTSEHSTNSRGTSLQSVVLPVIGLLVGLASAWGTGLLGENVLLAMDRAINQFSPPIQLLGGETFQLTVLVGLAAVGLLTLTWGRQQRVFIVLLLTGLGLIGLASGMERAPIYWLGILAPLVIIVAAYGLLQFALWFRWLGWGILVVVHISLLGAERLTMPPYADMTVPIEAGDGVVIAAEDVYQHAASRFYVQQQVPGLEPFHIMEAATYPDMRFVPAADSAIVTVEDAEESAALADWAGAYDTLWYIDDGSIISDPATSLTALQAFVPYTIREWKPEVGPPRRVVRYEQIPADLSDQALFGEILWLQQWTLLNDVNVQACQRIATQSWWRLEQGAPTNYLLSLTVVDGATGQGIAREDSALGAGETLLWRTDRPYFDERSVTLPCELGAGEYPLLFTVYSVDSNVLTVLGNPLYLTTLFVREP